MATMASWMARTASRAVPSNSHGAAKYGGLSSKHDLQSSFPNPSQRPSVPSTGPSHELHAAEVSSAARASLGDRISAREVVNAARTSRRPRVNLVASSTEDWRGCPPLIEVSTSTTARWRHRAGSGTRADLIDEPGAVARTITTDASIVLAVVIGATRVDL